ncbi:hypothetical protein GCM10025868_00550 [Angustibacter aerolatus]|uniref:Uncharacterized protein n=1 Tax=Angustibacter aerolatus TaxID=1162965 RepID=A0ABQ6JD96_9ACTN|nr:hypothetical protein GCM10025868_00550 [Angustibacter aerolatus]
MPPELLPADSTAVDGVLPAAVLWDMDGTLLDTEPYWIEGEHALVERYGGTWSDEHAHQAGRQRPHGVGRVHPRARPGAARARADRRRACSRGSCGWCVSTCRGDPARSSLLHECSAAACGAPW